MLATLTEEDEENINSQVWVSESNRGGLKISPLKIKLKKEGETVRQRQYNISLEGRRGLQLVVDGLLKDGLLEPCMSPFNTPVLPVRKPDGSFRKLNSLVEIRLPVVPNPCTLLSTIPHAHAWFSIVDLKDAF